MIFKMIHAPANVVGCKVGDLFKQDEDFNLVDYKGHTLFTCKQISDWWQTLKWCFEPIDESMITVE